MSDPRQWTNVDGQPLLTEDDVILVTDPLNSGEGRNMHTTYLVTGGAIEARHRYSDFQWLYNRLITELPGAMVPIIPHKRTVTMKKDIQFSEEFIEERRENLEKFMQGVFEISDVKSTLNKLGAASPSLINFLKLSSGEEFDNVKNNVEKDNPTNDSGMEDSSRGTKGMGGSMGASSSGGKSPGGKISGLFSRAKTAAQNSMGRVELQTTKEEADIMLLEEYVSELELYVKSLTEASKNLVKSTKDRSTAIKDFAIPIEAWKKSRQTYVDADTHGQAAAEADTTFSKILSTLIKMSESFISMLDQQHLEEQNKLEFGIQRLELHMKSIRMALKQRKQLQLEYTATVKKIDDKKVALEKANGGTGNEKLQHDIQQMKKAAILERRRLEECSERIIREKLRVLPLIESSLKSCILDYAEIQTDQSNVVSDAWLTLLENDNN